MVHHGGELDAPFVVTPRHDGGEGGGAVPAQAMLSQEVRASRDPIGTIPTFMA